MTRRTAVTPALALSASLALGLALTGCTHFGTNVAGDFACRDAKTGCQPLSEVDALTTRELLKAEAVNPAGPRPRIGLATGDTTRTGERTLRVIFPAHVDAAGTLHEEAAAWAVVEAPHWAGELRRAENTSKGAIEAVKQALRQAAQRAGAAQGSVADKPSVESDSDKADTSAPALPADTAATPPSFLHTASPFALPSPGGEASAGARTASADAPVAEGPDMFPTPHVRTPRPFGE